MKHFNATQLDSYTKQNNKNIMFTFSKCWPLCANHTEFVLAAALWATKRFLSLFAFTLQLKLFAFTSWYLHH